MNPGSESGSAITQPHPGRNLAWLPAKSEALRRWICLRKQSPRCPRHQGLPWERGGSALRECLRLPPRELGVLIAQEISSGAGDLPGLRPLCGDHRWERQRERSSCGAREGSPCIGLGLRHHPLRLGSAGRGRQQGTMSDRISERK